MHLGRREIRVAENCSRKPFNWYNYSFWASILWLALVFCYLFSPLPTYQHWHDLWEHVAAVRELATAPFSPTHPQLAVDAPSRQFIPSNILMAALVRAFSIQPVDMVLAAGPLYMAIVLLGLKRFLEKYYDDFRAPTLGLMVIYGLWGTPWVATGLHNARSVFYSAAYPSTLVFGIALFMWARVLVFSKRQIQWTDFVFFAVTTCFSFICHQLGSAIGLVMTFLLLGFNSGFANKAFFGVSLAVLTGLLASSLWPYFDPIALTLSGGRDPINRGNAQFESVVPVLLLIGPSMLGLLGIRRCLREHRFIAIPAGLFFFSGLYLIGAVAGNPVTHRLLAPAVLCLHFSFLVWLTAPGITTGPAVAQRKRFNAVVIMCLAFLLGQAGAVAIDISKVTINRLYSPEPWRFGIMPVVAEMTEVAQHLPPNAVVAADTSLSVSMPAFGGKLLASYRGINMIPDLQDRRKDNSLLLGDGTPLSARQAVISKYGVTHLLFMSTEVSTQTLETLLSLGNRLTAPPGFVLIQLLNH